MSNTALSVPDIRDVRRAATRIAGSAVRTPLLHGFSLDEITCTRVFLKPECLQRTGSFKFRGAYNAIARLSPEQRAAGVVACSSGNHAQGVAEAARLLGAKATIVMPGDAPAVKVARTKRSGADIIFYERATQDRDVLAADFQKRSGAAMIHPYNNSDVIAGQGTCGLEIAEQLDQLDVVPDRILVCTGGGGLTAGIVLAIHDRFPAARVHTVEPEGFDDTRRSLEAGKRLENKSLAGSECDALLSPSPGEISFEINKTGVACGLVVSDDEAFAAMRLAFTELKLVLEPGGAVALAALIANSSRWVGETVVCVLSGGNVDPDLFARVLSGSD